MEIQVSLPCKFNANTITQGSPLVGPVEITLRNPKSDWKEYWKADELKRKRPVVLLRSDLIDQTCLDITLGSSFLPKKNTSNGNEFNLLKRN
ncbi:hypothetical protein BpHYR1_054653 [Brachionus plicatilis]|uniref:Uncharacterized protein n=1 Tax=Brachionus plicatilis TaxID=10195 RepID=A0A3M7PW26_BRAPC|nr:hypothetical protein BpHYR1_054653 [Brachionus plicatilis]